MQKETRTDCKYYTTMYCMKHHKSLLMKKEIKKCSECKDYEKVKVV